MHIDWFVGNPAWIMHVHVFVDFCSPFALFSSDQRPAGPSLHSQERSREVLGPPIGAHPGRRVAATAERRSEGGRMGGKTATHPLRQYHH